MACSSAPLCSSAQQNIVPNPVTKEDPDNVRTAAHTLLQYSHPLQEIDQNLRITRVVDGKTALAQLPASLFQNGYSHCINQMHKVSRAICTQLYAAAKCIPPGKCNLWPGCTTCVLTSGLTIAQAAPK